MATALRPAPRRHPSPSELVEPLLESHNLRKSYKRGVWPRRRRTEMLKGASIELFPGEIVGLVGENGAGKSTLMKILVGTLERDGGEIHLRGRLGYCPQEPVLYERLTCEEHLRLFGRAYGLAEPEVLERSRRLYEALDFDSYRDVRVEELSGGTQAKLNLALALLPLPEVLLLDEPYAGLDWDTYLRFWELAEEQKAAGRAVLIISHFLADEERFDRVYDLAGGKAVQR